MSLLRNLRSRRFVSSGVLLSVTVLAGALALPTWAGDLAAVPTLMTPIYTNTAIGLGMIDAARRSTEAAYGKQDDSSSSNSHSRPSKAASSKPKVPIKANFVVGHDAAVSNKIKSQFLSGIRAHNNAQDAASITDTFTRKPVHAAYLEAAKPYGLGDSDLRDVSTAYMVVNWMVANQAGLPTVAQVRGVKHQLSQSMAQNPIATTAEQRQTAAEQMMYVLVSLIYARQQGQAQNRQLELKQMADTVANSFLQKKLDLRRLNLTNNGFVPR